jgi:hypothetical protein
LRKFIKKEYKKVTGNALSLTSKASEGDSSKYFPCPNISASHRFYKIGGSEGTDPILGRSEDSVDAKFKSFLDQGGWDGKTNAEAKGQPVYAGKGKVQPERIYTAHIRQSNVLSA